MYEITPGYIIYNTAFVFMPSKYITFPQGSCNPDIILAISVLSKKKIR